MDGPVAVYFEAAAVITVLVLLGQVLELRAREQTSGAITALLNLAPKPPDGWIMTVMKRILMRKMSCGDKLRIRPREYSGRRYRDRRQNNRG